MMKLLKFLAVTAGILIIGLFAALVLVIHMLPSPREISQNLKSEAAKPFMLAQNKSSPPTMNEIPQNPQTQNTNSSDTANSVTSESYERQRERDMIWQSMSDERQPLSDVCNYLRNVPVEGKAGAYGMQELGDKFGQSELSNDKDPLVQSVKPTLRYILRLPEVRRLIQIVQDANQKQDMGLFEKAEFYQQALSAGRELTGNKSSIESLLDQTYFLYTMSKVIAAKPELASDPRLQNYCQSIENAINNHNTFSIDKQKNEFNKFMEFAGVNSKEIDYDPDYKTSLQLSYDAEGIHFTAGWIDSLLRK